MTNKIHYIGYKAFVLVMIGKFNCETNFSELKMKEDKAFLGLTSFINTESEEIIFPVYLNLRLLDIGFFP